MCSTTQKAMYLCNRKVVHSLLWHLETRCSITGSAFGNMPTLSNENASHKTAKIWRNSLGHLEVHVAMPNSIKKKLIHFYISVYQNGHCSMQHQLFIRVRLIIWLRGFKITEGIVQRLSWWPHMLYKTKGGVLSLKTFVKDIVKQRSGHWATMGSDWRQYWRF